MILNTRIEDLRPDVAEKCRRFLQACKDAGLDVRLNETKRARVLQMIYALQTFYPLDEINLVRKEFGLWAPTADENTRRATWTLRSKHCDGLAFDAVVYKDGLPWWKAPRSVWEQMGTIGESCGLSWGGRWKNTDCPHFEVEA